MAFALSLLLLLVLLAFAISQLRGGADLRKQDVVHGRALLELVVLQESFGRKASSVEAHLLTGREDFLREGASARQEFLGRLEVLRRAGAPGEESRWLDAIATAEEAHHEAVLEAVRARGSGPPVETLSSSFLRIVEPRRRLVFEELASFAVYKENRLELADRTEERVSFRLAILLLATGSGALLLTLLTQALLRRRLARHDAFERAERRRVEAAEGRNAAALATALDAIITIDHTGRVLEFNPAAEDIFGYKRKDAAGRELAELIIPAALRERHRQGLAEYLVSGTGPVLGKRIEVPALRADGSQLQVELTITPLPGEGPPVFTGFLRDITERRQIESERARLLDTEREARAAAEISQRRSAFLAEAGAVLSSSLDYHETLKSVARLAVAAIADWCTVEMADETGRLKPLEVAHVDPAKVVLARELALRYPRNPDLPYGPAHVFRTGESELSSEISEEVLRSASSGEEHYRLLKDLGLRSYMCVPLKARGVSFGAMTFVSAESGRRYNREDLALAETLAYRASVAVDNARLYREAREAIRLREEFLSIASHELKTPVATLQLQLQTVARKAAAPGAAPESGWMAERLAAAQRQIERLAKLIEGLLDVSRLAAGKVELHVEDVDFAAVVSAVASRFEEELSRSGSSLTVRAEGESRGEWDAARLDQVVENLLGNAIRYGEGRPIAMTLDGDSETARLIVRDEGIGISSENQERIFERFERAVSERHYGGLGLGLFIVREIVTALGGSVRVASEPGKGAAFTVELPRRARRAPAPPVSSS